MIRIEKKPLLTLLALLPMVATAAEPAPAAAPRAAKPASSKPASSQPPKKNAADAVIGTGFSALFGIGAAGVASRSNDVSIESNKIGYELEGHAIGSLFVERIVIEAGGGWAYTKLSGDHASRKTTKGIDQDEVTIGAGFGSFGAGYRFAESFMLGPLSQVRFGTDTSYSPFDEGANANRPRVFAGLQAHIGETKKLGDLRFGMHFLTDINVSERQIFLAGVQLNFGVPIVKPDVVIKEKAVVKIKEKPVEKVVYRFLYTLDTEIVNFVTNSAQLLPESRDFLENLGKTLAANQDLWQYLDIAGHTDSRGSREHNLKLSSDRADEVKTVLIMQGIESGKIRTWGFGPDRPIDLGQDETALARNRRVEMSFEGVTDVSKLRAEIDRTRKSNHKPGTCDGQTCK